MNIQTLFQIQCELDEKIKANHHLQNESLVAKKVLALQVELGELANETRCFKFWSVKSSAEQEVILEEYVDGLHFILSLGLDCTYDQRMIKDQDVLFEMNGEQVEKDTQPDPEEKATSNEDDVPNAQGAQTTAFLAVYTSVEQFYQQRDYEHFVHMFECFITLGNVLGFSQEQIEQAYLKKNKMNHARQAEGY